MQIDFSPNNVRLEGICSRISWDNQQLRTALRGVFGESPRETLMRIIVERDGLTGVFETRPETIKKPQ